MQEIKKGAAGQANAKEVTHLQGTKNVAITPTFETSIFSKSTDPLSDRITFITSNPTAFPVHAFPSIIQEIIKNASDNLNFPTAYIAASILFAASMAIGSTHLLKMKGTWLESAVIYLALVGRPGANKSHPLTFSLAPIIKRDNELYTQYEKELEQYEADLTAYKRDRENEGREAPKKPALKKFLLSDTTPVAVIMILSNNKRGIGIYADELATWFKNFNRYNSGSEQEFYLSAWSGGVVNVDRKGYHVRIDRPSISVAGTIQPAILDELKKDSRGVNGFIERILFVYLSEVKRLAWHDGDMCEELRRRYTEIINRLLELSHTVGEQGLPESNLLTFEPKALQIIKEWQAANAQRDNELDSDVVNAISTKIEVYSIRFCLILQLLRWASGETQNKATIEPETAKNAILLADYFKGQAIAVTSYISNSNPVERLPENKQAIYSGLPNEFSTAAGLAIATAAGMISRTFENWLSEGAYFKCVKRGHWKKVYQSGVSVLSEASETGQKAA